MLKGWAGQMAAVKDRSQFWQSPVSPLSNCVPFSMHHRSIGIGTEHRQRGRERDQKECMSEHSCQSRLVWPSRWWHIQVLELGSQDTLS